MSCRSINPYDGEMPGTFDEQTGRQLESAITAAATCFEGWRRLSFVERAVIVAKAAATMRERAEEFTRPVTLERGKLFTESIGEVMLSPDILAPLSSEAALVRVSPIDAPA